MESKTFDEPLDRDILPQFADAETQALQLEVKRLQDEHDTLEEKLDESKGRVELLREQIKNITALLLSKQQVQRSKTQEVNSELHLKQVSEREASKYRNGIKKVNADIDEIQNKSTTLQNQIYGLDNKLLQIQQQEGMDRQTLEQWAVARAQKEDDAMAIQKYARQDEARIKELSLQVEKRTRDLKAREQQLEQEVTETRAFQIELDKTGIDFKALHAERQQLLVQYEETIAVMESRDADIQRMHESVDNMRRVLGERKAIIADRQKFLKAEQDNNREIETKIEKAERELVKMRMEHINAQKSIEGFEDEVTAVRNNLKASAAALQEARSKNTHFVKEMEKKRKLIEHAVATYEQTRDSLEANYQQTDDLDARSRQIEAYFKEEEFRQAKAEKELTDLQQHMFKQAQELQKFREAEENILSELSGVKVADKNLSSKIHKLDTESLKQQELVYNQEYQLQQLERKISKYQHEKSSEQKAALQAKIKELNVDLSAQNEQFQLLETQHKKIDDDLRGAKRKLEADQKERALLANKISELTLENETAARNLKQTIKKKEELMVAENFVRLDVKRLRDLLYNKADEVYGLENRSLQLKLSMEERNREIIVQKETLHAQIRVAEEERSARAKDLADRLIRIDKLKKKYQILMLKIAPEYDSNEKERSQAYYIIKAAQLKEELQKEKEAQERSISESEEDVRQLSQAVVMMNDYNAHLHVQKTRGGLTASDTQQQEAIVENYNQATATYHQLQSEYQKLEGDIARISDQLLEIKQAQRTLFTIVSDSEMTRGSLSRELVDQKAKVQRAQLMVNKILKAYKKKKGLADTHQTVIDKDIRLQEERDRVHALLRGLADLAASNPELSYQIATYVSAAGDLKLPLAGSQPGNSNISTRSATPVGAYSRVSSRGSVSSVASQPAPAGDPHWAQIQSRQPATSSQPGSRAVSQPSSRAGSQTGSRTGSTYVFLTLLASCTAQHMVS
eukprot:TRINITY_DN2685_c0_g2_i2.p1 TRINITY_DN2685_c0_g2~~TRINITY_DN2685_c0_g2_i2.p1  ORF type:complete len:973 (-),score=307.68 TRINITY_DN2685_c0_g2_i2:73-2991(-)